MVPKINRTRTESGMSLPTVIALGVVASMWMLGTASLVVPAANKITTERLMDVARCSAEAGLDYALQKINDTTSRSSMISSTTYTIPNTVMADYDSTKSPPSRFTGTVKIQNVRPPSTLTPNTDTYTSYLYDQTVDDQQNSSYLYNAGTNNNMWRILTATVSNGNVSRAVRVILKPVITTTSTSSTTQVNGTPTPIFAFTAFGVGSVTSHGGTVNSYDSHGNSTALPTGFDTIASAHITETANATTPGYGDLASDGSITLTGSNNTIGGNIQSFGSGANNTVTGTGQVGTISGAVDGANISGITGASGNSTTATLTTQEVPPMKAEPSTFDNSKITGNPTSISLSGNNSTLTLTAGNYKFNSIKITGNNAKLIIDNSQGPVNIWVGGTNSTVAIGGKGIANTTGVAANLAIWYEGTNSVSVHGNGAFNGVVWAAGAPVDISGNAGFYGAAIGSTIDLNGNNAAFHYDRDLMRESQLMYTPLVNKTITTTINNLNNWQAVSWHEFNPNSPF
jgi:hypothetical protein